MSAITEHDYHQRQSDGGAAPGEGALREASDCGAAVAGAAAPLGQSHRVGACGDEACRAESVSGGEGLRLSNTSGGGEGAPPPAVPADADAPAIVWQNPAYRPDVGAP